MLTRASVRAKDFLARHGLITVDMLQKQGYTCRESAYRQLRRLELDKKLRAFPLYAKVCYYRNRGDPTLGPQQLPICYAIAMHCADQGLFKPHIWEVRSTYPWLEGIDYAMEGEQIILFRVHVTGESDAQVRKASKLHRRLSQYAAYLKLLGEGRISVRILTATEEKAKEINWYINRNESTVPISVAIVAGYEQVLGALAHA